MVGKKGKIVTTMAGEKGLVIANCHYDEKN